MVSDLNYTQFDIKALFNPVQMYNGSLHSTLAKSKHIARQTFCNINV